MNVESNFLGKTKNYIQEIPFLIRTDSYKAGHAIMYPDTNELVAYAEHRKPFFADDHRIVLFGIRYKLETLLNRRVTMSDIQAADAWYKTHGVGKTQFYYPRDLWIKVVENGGWIPLEVYALQDGTVFYPHIPYLQIIGRSNSLSRDHFEHLVTWLEPELMHVWSPTVTATKSRIVRELYEEAFNKSVDESDFFLLDSRFHDFGYRGATSTESAMVTGAGHLLSFEGTDTQPAGWLATQMNNGKPIGESVLASEHSVALSWLMRDGEVGQVRHFLNMAPEGSIVSNIADTVDYFAYLTEVIPEFVDIVRKKGMVFVVRPDSGDTIQCVLSGMRELDKVFGSRVNNKGYKVLLNSAVIQGDGLELHNIPELITAVMEAGYSAQNLACGMGGGLLQKQNRDTLSTAMKLSHVEYSNGQSFDVMKIPATDHGKYSLPGRISVIQKKDGSLESVPYELCDRNSDLLKIIWKPTESQEDYATFIENSGGEFDSMRERCRSQWKIRPKTPNVISSTLKQKILKTTSLFREET